MKTIAPSDDPIRFRHTPCSHRGGSMIEINGVRLYTKKEIAEHAKEALEERERREGVKRTRLQRFWNWITMEPYRRYD